MKKRSIPTASGVPVFCKFDKIVPAASLKLWPGNMKKHPASNLDAAYAVVVGTDKKKGNGWRRSVVVSTFSGLVTKGNGMVQMAQRHGLDVPVEHQAYKNRREEIRDLIADNKLPLHSTDDTDALKKLLGELETDDLAMTAVTDSEIDALIHSLTPATELVPVEVKPPPETAWILIGIPVSRWKEIATHVEAISQIKGIEYHSGTGTAQVNPDENEEG